jgi:H+/gluconate symporter-like permease
VTLVLLIALADELGMVGIVIAPPLSVVSQILWNQLIKRHTKPDPVNLLSDLKERMLKLRAAVDEMEEPRLPLITSSVERITNLFDDAEPVLKAGFLVDE